MSSQRQLSEEALNRLLASFSKDTAEAAMRMTSMLARLQKYFAWSRCEEPEELAWETLSRVARRITEGEQVENVEAYAAGVARLVLKEAAARSRRQSNALAELQHASQSARDAPSGSEAPNLEQASAALDRCLNELSSGNRGLLLRYYEGEEGARIRNRQRMAEELGISLNALRNRALRLREQVERSLRSRLASEDGV